LIIDDEADNASIGYVNDRVLGLQLRTIADKIDDLRQHLPLASFLQVTATPYSLYLQPDNSPLQGMNLAPVRPKFTELVPVHRDYVGSHFYFEESKDQNSPAAFVFQPVSSNELSILRQPDARRFRLEECLTSDKVGGLRSALVAFITGSCIRRFQEEQMNRRPKGFAFLFHTEAAKVSHAWQDSIINEFDLRLQAEARTPTGLLRSLVKTAYDDLARSILAANQPLPAFDEVFRRVTAALTGGEITITKVNSEAQVTALLDDDGQLKLRNPLNIFIGGQILDRGITIANLIGFYYGRDPQRFQQDTVLQHSRMYGFRPAVDCAVTRFFTAPHIYAAMRRMHEADTALRDRIEAHDGDMTVAFIELDDLGTIIPCSPTKILASNITTLRPHRRILPVGFQTDYKTRLLPITEGIDAKLATLCNVPGPSVTPGPVDISLADALDLIERLGPTFVDFDPGYEDRWNVAEYKAILKHLSDNSPNPQTRGRVLLLLRTGREINRLQASGQFSDAPDTAQRETTMARQAATDLPVLMLFRQKGEEAQGWRGCPFWWPVIVPPLATRTTLFAHFR
jgi:hypothetical protein